MTVEPAKAAGDFDYKGTKYYFCSKHCLHSFKADPERYLSKKALALHPLTDADIEAVKKLTGGDAAAK